jgi:hypothetical protein
MPLLRAVPTRVSRCRKASAFLVESTHACFPKATCASCRSGQTRLPRHSPQAQASPLRGSPRSWGRRQYFLERNGWFLARIKLARQGPFRSECNACLLRTHCGPPIGTCSFGWRNPRPSDRPPEGPGKVAVCRCTPGRWGAGSWRSAC